MKIKKIKMLKTHFYFDDVTLPHQENVCKKFGIKLASSFLFFFLFRGKIDCKHNDVCSHVMKSHTTNKKNLRHKKINRFSESLEFAFPDPNK